MIRTLSAFLEFCYLARRNFHTEETLRDMSSYLNKFHENRMVFIETGVRKDLNPPANMHFAIMYRLFKILEL